MPREGWLCVWAACIWVVCLFGTSRLGAAEPIFRARTHAGESLGGPLTPLDDERWELRDDDGRRVPWEKLHRLEPERGAFAGSPRPLRRVALRGGDAIAVAILGSSEQRLSTFAVSGRLEIPWGALDTVEAMPGEHTLLYESCEAPPKGWIAEAGSLDVATDGPVAAERGGRRPALVLASGTRLRLPALPAWSAGRLQWVDEPRPRSSGRWIVEIELRSADDPPARGTLRVRMDMGPAPPIVESDPPERFDHQPLPDWTPTAANEGRRTLTVMLSHGRAQVSVDGQLRAAGRAPEGTVAAIRLISEPAIDRRPNGGDAGRGARIGQVQVVTHTAASRPTAPIFDRRADVVRLTTGDELFGTLRAVDGEGVAWESSRKTVRAEWSDVAQFGLAPRPIDLKAVSGHLARVVLAAPTDRPPRADDAYGALVGAITRLDETSLQLDHPALGPLRLPLVTVQRIEPHHFGALQVIDPDVHHFGTAVRPTFQRPLPEGTRRTIEFTATPPVAPARAVVALTVRELEPSGPDAPPGTPFLAEVRAGGLLTEVWLNETPLGNLNSKIRHKRGVEPDQTIRLDVPPVAWKPGRNTLRIEQRSARNDPASYDDCEIGPIRIESRR